MMLPSKRCHRGLLLASVAVALACSYPMSAAAADPFLALRLAGGQGWSYPLADAEALVFGDTTLRVITTGGSDLYPMESIVRIDFDLDAWTGIEVPEPAQDVARTLHVLQNQPNPFCPETRIAFAMPRDGRVELRIYSVDGRLVRTLADEERLAGPHSVVWDGTDESGRAVSSGVYFYTLAAPGFEESRKMILVR